MGREQYIEDAREFLKRNPPPQWWPEHEIDALIDELAGIKATWAANIEAKVALGTSLLQVAAEREIDDPSAVSDDAIRALALEAEIPVASQVEPPWGKSAASIRNYLETERAERAVISVIDLDEFTNDEIDRIVRETKRDMRAHFAKRTAREKLRQKGSKEAGDLAEMFVEDPERANKLWDQIYGE